MSEFNAEWSTFTDYCKRLLEDKQKNGAFPPFGRVGGLEPSMLETLDATLRAIVYTMENKDEKGNPKLPPKVWIRTKDTNTPTPTVNKYNPSTGVYYDQDQGSEDQPDAYSCGSTTLANILDAMGLSAQRSEVSPYTKTSTHGTNPSDLMTGAVSFAKAKYGINLISAKYNYSATGLDQIGRWIMQPNVGVILLIRTKPLIASGIYKGDYEHYITLRSINIPAGTVKVNDPARSYDYDMKISTLEKCIGLVSRESVYVFTRV